VALHQTQAFGGVKALHQDRGRSRVHGAAHEHGAVDVIEGQKDQQAITLPHPECRDHLDVVGDEIPVGEHHPLGESRGAAGVGKRHQVAIADLDGRRRHRPLALDERGQALDPRLPGGHSRPDGNDVAETPNPPPHRLHEGQQVGVGHHRHRLRIVELIFDFALAIGGIHGADHRPHPGDAVEGDDVLGAVAGQQADLVAVLDPECPKRVGEAGGQAFQLPVGEAHITEDEGHVLRPTRGRVRQHPIVGNARVVEMGPEELGTSDRGCRHRSIPHAWRAKRSWMLE
jgi:hypothetical protein